MERNQLFIAILSRSSNILQLFNSLTFRRTVLVFSGNLISSGIGFLSLILLSRKLGPEQFGVFSTATALMAVLVGLTDFGISSGLVRFVSQYLSSNRKRVDVFLSVAFRIEIILGFLIIVAGVLFYRLLAELLYKNESLSLPIVLAFVGGFGMSLGAFITAVFQAYQKFIKLSLFGLLSSLPKFAFILMFLITGALNLNNALIVYAVIPIVVFIIGLTLLPKNFYKKHPESESREVFWELFNFSKWIMLSFFATSISGRLDILMLSHFRNSAEVGVYGAAFQLSTVLPILIGSLTSVLYPKASSLEDSKENFVSYAKKTLGLSTLFIILMIPVLLFSPEIVSLIFGQRYEEAAPAFRIIFIGYMAGVIANPVSLIIFRLNKVKYITLINYVLLVLIFGLDLILIPMFGQIGAALTFLISNLIGSLIIVLYSFLLIRRQPLSIKNEAN